ncbi:MFS general substrate transporter [Rhizoclosmatium globosum]|uniref:MFS general substrate transporter n=1 Tax=Rhizoclosmatium globosum TaxID=329046 RepID=A0A1Y2D159_9FUNG|nr:MFS general substrate transporter [Rhizoclosmatium globosum]|eukprot:ORY53019.1 MFS general substrate transporter [Rhizoclosmatium globosum]
MAAENDTPLSSSNTPDDTVFVASGKDVSMNIEEGATSALEFPDGGLQAWLVVGGSFIAHFVVYGMVYGFGIYNSYYIGLGIGSAFEVAMIGLMYGTGASLIYFPAVSLPSQYFEKKRGLATGIAVAGTGCGGLVFSVLTEKLISSVGLGWTLRITAILCFALMMLITPVMKTRLPRSVHTDFAFLKAPVFYYLLFACFLANWVMFVPLDFLPVCASQVVNLPLSDQSTIMAVYNACNILGRVVMVGSVFWWLGVNSYGSLLGFGALNGFFDGERKFDGSLVEPNKHYLPKSLGAFWGLFPVVVASVFGADSSLATMLATLYTLLALGNFGSAPMSGFIEEKYGMNAMIIYTGVFSVLAAVFGTAARFTLAREWMKRV